MSATIPRASGGSCGTVLTAPAGGFGGMLAGAALLQRHQQQHLEFLQRSLGDFAPIATNYIVTWDRLICGAFPLAGMVLLLGIFAYLVLLGEITSLPDREPSLAHETAGGH